MRPKRAMEQDPKSAEEGFPRAESACRGRAGSRALPPPSGISLRGLQEGLGTESAIKQEVAIACLLVPLSFFVAKDVWTWVALIASLLFVLSDRVHEHGDRAAVQPHPAGGMRRSASPRISPRPRVFLAAVGRAGLARRAMGALYGLTAVAQSSDGDSGAELGDAGAEAGRGGDRSADRPPGAWPAGSATLAWTASSSEAFGLSALVSTTW